MSEADPDYDAKVLEKEALWEHVEEILEKRNITASYASNFTQNLRKEYGVPSIFSQTRTDAIWTGVKTVLYRGGRQLHFKSCGDIPELAAKEALIHFRWFPQRTSRRRWIFPLEDREV